MKPEKLRTGRVVIALVLLLVAMLGLLYALPFLAGAQNIIGLLIIFFGLAQAWRLNKKVRPEIKGPFVVGSSSPPLEGAPAHA